MPRRNRRKDEARGLNVGNLLKAVGGYSPTGEASGRSADAARQASRPLPAVRTVTRDDLDSLRRATGR